MRVNHAVHMYLKIINYLEFWPKWNFLFLSAFSPVARGKQAKQYYSCNNNYYSLTSWWIESQMSVSFFHPLRTFSPNFIAFFVVSGTASSYWVYSQDLIQKHWWNMSLRWPFCFCLDPTLFTRKGMDNAQCYNLQLKYGFWLEVMSYGSKLNNYLGRTKLIITP